MDKKEIEKYMKENADLFRGPPGPVGQTGYRGRAGRDGTDIGINGIVIVSSLTYLLIELIRWLF